MGCRDELVSSFSTWARGEVVSNSPLKVRTGDECTASEWDEVHHAHAVAAPQPSALRSHHELRYWLPLCERDRAGLLRRTVNATSNQQAYFLEKVQGKLHHLACKSKRRQRATAKGMRDVTQRPGRGKRGFALAFEVKD